MGSIELRLGERSGIQNDHIVALDNLRDVFRGAIFTDLTRRMYRLRRAWFELSLG